MTRAVLVDTSSALEFHREILERISERDLSDAAFAAQRKSETMRELLSLEPTIMTRSRLREVLRLIFVTRRCADQILDVAGHWSLANAVDDLLRGEGPVADRFDRFDSFLGVLSATPRLARAGFDLASELLHFSSPDEYWLWTRWIWDPEAKTGALALVTTGIDLSDAESRGALYMNVGRATAQLDATGKVIGFTGAGPSLFGADVLLAAVYGVYMSTVLRMRMTREFTQLLPSLPVLVHQLLGTTRTEVRPPCQ